MTFRNRAPYLVKHFDNILRQDYDLKKLTYVIGDGNSDDGLMDVLEKYKKYFKKIIFYISDRSVLPFKIPFNNPSIDYNVSVLMAPDKMVIRTDPEILFPHKESLRLIGSLHALYPTKLIHFNCIKVFKSFDPYNEEHINNPTKHTAHQFPYCTDSARSMVFSKDIFENDVGGFDERFVTGFCAEDSYLTHYWRVHYGFVQVPEEYFTVHLDHGMEHYNKTSEAVRWNYSVPLMRGMQARDERANLNADWKRLNMVKNLVELS